MKILVICQHYWPEPYPLADICEELVQRGHEVDVVTDVPNYPMGKTYPGYKKGNRRREKHNNVTIIRTFTIPRGRSVIGRLLNYYSYAISSTLYISKVRKEYDVVFCNQTSPVMMSTAAFSYGKKHGKKVVLYCMDLWPACLAAGGIRENTLIYRYFGRQAKRLYNKADCILITSQMFREYLVKEHSVDERKIQYLPQYAVASFEEINEIAKTKETVDLVFAGNIGTAQSIQTILRAAEILKNILQLRWHIVGDGSALTNMQMIAKEKQLKNVIFHGRHPITEMPQYYAMADAMVITLTANPFISLTLPGKVQSYMAAGKPILAAANGEIPKVIAKAECGYCVAAEDADGLSEVVKLFLRESDWKKLGKNARTYYDTHFTKQQFINTLETVLHKYAGSIQ